MSSVVSHRKIQMDLWPFFFFNTTQKSLATVDVDAYMGWCIWNIQQFKSLKKTIAFSKSVSVCLWMIWCMSGMDQGDKDTSDVKIMCHDLWKNWYSMSAVQILRTTVKSFRMKSLIQVFFPKSVQCFTFWSTTARIQARSFCNLLYI